MNASATSAKRKLKTFTLQEKINILNSINSGQSKSSICKDYNVGESTLRKWVHDEQKLRDLWTKDNVCVSHKKIRSEENAHLSQALFIWFKQSRDKGIPISGPILRGKARQLNKQLGGKNEFTASDGWLSKWKKRNNIRQLTICGEKKSADDNAAEEFKTKLAEIVHEESLSRCQIFNCDETGLNYKMLPNKTLSQKSERQAEGFKKNKDRVTVMACSNADGSLKLPLVVIGKSAKPRALKSILNNLPVYYTNQQKAWMNRNIFNEWFQKEFVPRVTAFLRERNLPVKAILIVDNASSHVELDSLIGDIRTYFLPPNVTSILQPMDQGILQTLKMRYKHRLISSVVNAQDDGIDTINHLKAINLRDVIYWISNAWEEVTPNTITKCWKKLLPEHHSNEESQDSISEEMTSAIRDVLNRTIDYNNCDEIQFNEWIFDENNLTSETMTDDQIIQMVTSNNLDDNLNEDNDTFIDDDLVTASDAMNALDKAINFFEKNGNATTSDMMTLHRLKGKALSIKIKT